MSPATMALSRRNGRPGHGITSPFPSSPYRRLTCVRQNGGYINPPRQKRQFRDPYGDWWDKQERRNFGEPVHEDNDILGVFSPEEYPHYKSPMAFFLVGCVIATFGAFAGAMYFVYPDPPAAPRTFPGGLEAELGGSGAVRALKDGESWTELDNLRKPNVDSKSA